MVRNRQEQVPVDYITGPPNVTSAGLAATNMNASTAAKILWHKHVLTEET